MSNIKSNKEKITLTIAPEIKEYLQQQSEAFGMSMSAYTTMLISNYRQQTQAMAQLGTLQETVARIEKLAKENIKLPSEIKANN